MGGFLQVFGACPTPAGQGLAGGSTEHREAETSLGAFREVAEEGGSGPDSCRKVLPSGGPGGAPLWGRNMGIDGKYSE